MDLEDRIKYFHDFELSLTDEELSYWDVFRHDLFLIVVYKESFPETQKKLRANLLKDLIKLFLALIEYIRLCFIKKNHRVLFTCSRYKINNQFTDVNVNDILKYDEKSFYCIETYYKSDYLKALYVRILNKKNKIIANRLLSNEFVQKINNYFGTNLNICFFIDEIQCYLNETYYYKFLFRKLKPKSVFYIQNGIHKGLIKACKELTIPIVEIQHGEIGPSHPAYHYPIGFKQNYIIAADYLFVWSDFWKNRINFPGVNVEVIGNSYYCVEKNVKEKKKEYDFTIISNTAHTPIFDSFLEKLLTTGYKGNICYKLHPQQKDEVNLIKERWHNYSNIEVILFEKNAIDVIEESNAVFMIHSTVAFQALDMNCKVILYTANDEYLSHKDIFNYPNVYLANDVNEFLDNLQIPIKENKNKIYQNFDLEYFDRFIKVHNL